MVYYLFIHQPDFFILTYNPLTMPTVDMLISFNETGRSYLALILEVIELCPSMPQFIYIEWKIPPQMAQHRPMNSNTHCTAYTAHCLQYLHCLCCYMAFWASGQKRRAGVNKKPQKFIFEYWVFSQKSFLNVGCLKKSIFAYLKLNICIPVNFQAYLDI